MGGSTCSASSSPASSSSSSGNASDSQISPGGSRWRPDACASIRRSVGVPCAASGRCFESGSSRSSLPSSRTWRTEAAVKVLVIEATAYWVSGDASMPCSTSARPVASLKASSSPRKSAALMLGSRPARCASSTSRRKRSGAGKCSKRPRDQLDGPLDVLVVDVEVRHRSQDRRVHGHREPDALLRETLQRFGGAEPERADVDLDEVGLDLLEVDGHAGVVEPLGQPPRADVVVSQAVDVMLERDRKST